MAKIAEHAVVLGASMAGLLAARVLTEFYETVTVVERDWLPDGPVNRRGVPQGRHAHGLLGRGSQILDELFPGFLDDLVAAGAPVHDYTDLSESLLDVAGHRIVHSGGYRDVPPGFFPSRPLLEWLVRRRIRDTANITLLEDHDVVDVTTTAAGDRVTGARIRSRGGAHERVLTADLVVDATGRSARTPAFLDAMGYGRPTEERVGVRVVYSSQLLRIPPGVLKEKVVLVSPRPGRPTAMALAHNENDTWMFTIGGMVGVEPPSEPTEMLAFIQELVPELRSCGDRRRRAVERGLSFPLPGESLATLRQDAAVPRRSAGGRRRDLQLQPDLRPRHDGGRPAGPGAAPIVTTRRKWFGAAVFPRRSQTHRGRLAIRRRR